MLHKTTYQVVGLSLGVSGRTREVDGTGGRGDDPNRTGIQHINHQVEDLDDVMKSYYFLKQQGVRIVWGPGRHPVSTAIMVYFEGPDGMTYEYSVGVKHIFPEQEATYRPRQFPLEKFSFCMWGSEPGFSLEAPDEESAEPIARAV